MLNKFLEISNDYRWKNKDTCYVYKKKVDDKKLVNEVEFEVNRIKERYNVDVNKFRECLLENMTSIHNFKKHYPKIERMFEIYDKYKKEMTQENMDLIVNLIQHFRMWLPKEKRLGRNYTLASFMLETYLQYEQPEGEEGEGG